MFTIVFGILSGCMLAVLVGLLGSRRKLGFGWSFLLSVLFTPLVGLVCALISDPLPQGETRWGCIGWIVAILGIIFFLTFLVLLVVGGVMAFA